MGNPWEEIPLQVYEEHMKSSEIFQLQTLNRIMKDQINGRPVKTLVILGIAGGNGLEHIDPAEVERVYGIDINANYLNSCRTRFAHLGSCLTLIRTDVADPAAELPEAELVIADLFIEYIGIGTFTTLIRKTMPQTVSCVIQESAGARFVSASPYQKWFDGLSAIHCEVDKGALTQGMRQAGYSLNSEEKFELPNGKKFIRLDFSL
jgi:hypothetical protein